MGETNRIGPLAGYRPGGTARNGMPAPGGYRYNGTRRGVQAPAAAPGTDPLTAARLSRAAAQRAERLERVVAFSRLLEDGKTFHEAREALGIAEGTARDYLREIRKWGAE